MYRPISGISATRDWMWRTNSCSTASRSPRIGSKICARSAKTAISALCRSMGTAAWCGRLTILNFRAECQRAKPLLRRRLVMQERQAADRHTASAAVPAEHRREFYRVCWPHLPPARPRTSATVPPPCATNAGSFRLPRCGTAPDTAHRSRRAPGRLAPAAQPHADRPPAETSRSRQTRAWNPSLSALEPWSASPVKQ